MISADSTAEEAPARDAMPPGPRGVPVFGCLNGLLRNPMEFWSSIARRYGGLARVRLNGGRHAYLVSDPKLLYELLVTKRSKYRKNTRYKAAVDTFGAGLLLNEGAPWKRQRLLTQPTFKPDYVKSQVARLARLTREHLDDWYAVADRPVARNIDDDFFTLARRLAGHYLMGSGFADIETEFGAAARDIKDNWPLPPRSVLALVGSRRFFRSREIAREKRFDAAIAAIDDCLRVFLARARGNEFRDCGVLEAIALGSRDQGDAFDDKSLRDQLLTMFFAGHETSATSLSWTHYLLSCHRDVRARMQAEIRAQLGTRLDPTADDLEHFTYMQQVINESLRLYSPIHSISRVALEDDTIGGFTIPRGSMIYVSMHAIHRLPALWPDPDRFDPERFSPEATAAQERFAFIPFAAGHRNCIGAAMSNTEAKLVITQIAQRFELEHDSSHRIVPTAGTVMHPKGGMPMFITTRTLQ